MDNIMDLLLELKAFRHEYFTNSSQESFAPFSDASFKLAEAVKERIKEGGTVTFEGTDFQRSYELTETESLSNNNVDWLYFTDSEGRRIGFRMSRADKVSVEY